MHRGDWQTAVIKESLRLSYSVVGPLPSGRRGQSFPGQCKPMIHSPAFEQLN